MLFDKLKAFFLSKNKYLLLRLMFNQIVLFILVKILPLKFILDHLENKKVNSRTKKNIKISFIYINQAKIANFLKITQCLISSLNLYITLKSYGFKPTLEIGVSNKHNEFESHSWIRVDNYVLQDKKENTKYKKIISI